MTNLEERFQIPLGVAVAALGLLLLGAANARLPRRAAEPLRRSSWPQPCLPRCRPAAAASGDGSRGAGPGCSAGSSPTPLPVLERLLGSARAEAKLGKKAMDEKRYDDAGNALPAGDRAQALGPDRPVQPRLRARHGREDPGGRRVARRRAPEGDGRLAADAAFNTGTTLLRGGDYEGGRRGFPRRAAPRPR